MAWEPLIPLLNEEDDSATMWPGSVLSFFFGALCCLLRFSGVLAGLGPNATGYRNILSCVSLIDTIWPAQLEMWQRLGITVLCRTGKAMCHLWG